MLVFNIMIYTVSIYEAVWDVIYVYSQEGYVFSFNCCTKGFCFGGEEIRTFR